MIIRLNELYGISSVSVAAEDDPAMPRLSEEVLRKIFGGKAPVSDTETILYNAGKFREALDRALGTSETIWGTRYAEMSLRMQKQIYQFCAAKSIAEMRSLASLAAGKQGTVRTFDEFRHGRTQAQPLQ